MDYLHVTNIEKHNPGYKDRESKWLKYHFSANNDHGFDRLCEIDKWRFIEFIRLEIQTKKPVAIDKDYLKRQGFDLKMRKLDSTVRQLRESLLVECGSTTGWLEVHSRLTRDSLEKPKIVTTKGLTGKSVTQRREEKRRVYNKKHNKKTEPMIPPSFQEVSLYIQEKEYQVNAKVFFDKYENENPPWSNNKGKPMTSWKSTLATWNGNAQKTDTARNRDDHGKPRVVL